MMSLVALGRPRLSITSTQAEDRSPWSCRMVGSAVSSRSPSTATLRRRGAARRRRRNWGVPGSRTPRRVWSKARRPAACEVAAQSPPTGRSVPARTARAYGSSAAGSRPPACTPAAGPGGAPDPGRAAPTGRSRGPRATATTKLLTAAPGGADLTVAGRRSRCAARSTANAEEAEALGRQPAHLRRVLSHAAGEGDRVEAAQGGGHRRDAGPQAMHVDVEREPRVRRRDGGRRPRRVRGGVVAHAGGDQHLAHVGGAGQARAVPSGAPARPRAPSDGRPDVLLQPEDETRDRRLPERVAITRPSSGVKPMVVSTEQPSRTAASDAPAPRWHVTTRKPAGSRPASSAGAPRGP